MHQVAPDVWQVALAPRNGVNAWVVGDVLVDAGTTGMGKKLPQRIAGHTIAAHTITHADPDHVGGSQHVVDALGVPFWCPAGDVADVRAGRASIGETRLKPVLSRGNKIPQVPIERELREGDEVAGFTVLEVPGHTAGHIALWRESDRVLVGGDTFFNLSIRTFRYGLHEPPGPFTVDPARNRASMRRLAELEPEVACFGHGPPVTGAASKLRAFVAGLPA